MGFSFTGLSAARASGRNAKLDLNGDYAVVVTKVCESKSDTTGDQTYVIETTVLESTNPRIAVGEDRTITINRLDSKVDWKQRLAFTNLKGFLGACLSWINEQFVDPEIEALDNDPIGWEKAAKASLDEGLCDGARIRVKIFRKDTKKTDELRKQGAPESTIEESKFPEPKFRAYHEYT